MSDDDATTVAAGAIRVFDNVVPALDVGDYLVNVTQRIHPVTPVGLKPIDECHAISQPFSVRGPRFALPPRDVVSVFPADNAVGLFHQVLPHVVFTQRELPWERNLFDDADQTQRTPWLALLLFVDGEQIGGHPTLLAVPGAAKSRTLAAPLPASELVEAHHDDDGIVWPALEQEWYETLDSTTATVIDVSASAWITLLPSRADLRYLAHARKIDPTAKASGVLAQTGDGWYSVVVANRVADAPAVGQPGRRNIVHLVSLEGLEDHIAGKALPAGAQRVRMIALRSWSYTCLADAGESFSGLMNGLITASDGTPRRTTFALAADVPADASPDVLDAATSLKRGYVPLRYATRLGEQTFGWYRGPFSPVPVTSLADPGRRSPTDQPTWTGFATASAATAYDAGRGVFDLSYATAWATGRAMALADASFCQELLRWERDGHRMVDIVHERARQMPVLRDLDASAAGGAGEQSVRELLEPYALTGRFVRHLVTRLGQQLTPKAHDGPAEPPPRSAPFTRTTAAAPAPRTIAAILAQPGVRDAVRAAGDDGLDAIAGWLAQRYLLAGVPFETLVPHPSLLPPESIRFFYVDPNWLASLLEGALSVGIGTSRDTLYQDLMKDLIWEAMLKAVREHRNNLLTRFGATAAQVPDGAPLAGMLLRSAAVSTWPGLELRAYATSDGQTPIPILRMERPASDMLLCLWPQVPERVTVDEPPEGIAFGFEDPPTKGEGLWLYPRSLDEHSYGMPLKDAQPIDAVAAGAIDARTNVVRIGGDGGLAATLQAQLKMPLHVRDVAVQLVRVPEQAVFTTSPGAS